MLAAIAMVVLGLGAVTATSFTSSTSSAKFGGIGSAHEHAAFVVKVDSNAIDFSAMKYQVKSQYIHVENGIGTTLHKHASFVPIGEFLKSVGMDISNGCFTMDDGKRYCDSDEDRLRFFVNGAEHPKSQIMGYILNDDDRFLVIYGNETPDEIQRELSKLDEVQIFRS